MEGLINHAEEEPALYLMRIMRWGIIKREKYSSRKMEDKSQEPKARGQIMSLTAVIDYKHRFIIFT